MILTTKTKVKVLAAIVIFGEFCEAAILAPNSTIFANISSNGVPTPTSTGLTNEQLAGALAAALAGNGGSFGSFGGLILGSGAEGPAAWQAPAPAAAPGFRAQGRPFPPIERPNGVTAHFAKVTGQGDASIYSCYQSHLDYSSQSRSYIVNASGTRVYSTVTESHSILVTKYTNTSVPTTTLCDGWPRVLGATETPVTLTFTDSHPITSHEVFPGPAPTCKIPDVQCNVAYSAYDTATYSYLSSTFFQFFSEKKVGLPPNINFGTLTPPCANGGRISSCPTATTSASCTLNAGQATVFYWPAATPAKFCSGLTEPAATISAARPSIAVFRNATITSPSALVILRSVSANAASKVTEKYAYSNWQQCGNHIDATLTLPATALSTMRNSWTISFMNGPYTSWGPSKIPYSLEVADLHPGSVSWDAYAAAKGCNSIEKDHHACPKTILDDYTPTLSLPKEATAVGVNSEFAVCAPSLVQEAVYVPITAAIIEVPASTRYGMTVTVGPRETKIEPAVVARFMAAEVTPAPKL